MEVDIVCVGFGPAAGGFLSTLARRLSDAEKPPLESRAMPGMPPQVICYERADGIGYGVSGAVTRARGIRQSFPDLDRAQVPMAAPVVREKLVYLLDPDGASRRSTTVKLADAVVRPFCRDRAYELPFLPGFLNKHGGLVLSLGQFNQWVGEQLMAGGMVQIWPSMPVAEALLKDSKVSGVRLLDQGVSAKGDPEAGYLPGMDVGARLTVVADGPVGAVGRQLDRVFRKPDPDPHEEWAVGSKMVIELPESVDLEPGTVIHTIGYPEPEIFGFLYVHPDRLVSAGIFIPSWFANPVRTSYRYLQHFIQHPYLWRWLKGGRMVSWGAKSIQEAGRRREPLLAGDGFARIGEGSGSTNVLANSGVDEAWTTGVLLGEAVVELLEQGRDFTREALEETYVRRRRSSWVDEGARKAEKARNGFAWGFVPGMIGMALAGFSGGRFSFPGGEPAGPNSIEKHYGIPAKEAAAIREACAAGKKPLHDALMDRAGWPAIPNDGQLLVSLQDALLVGGKVQAQPGYADHVVFIEPESCRSCGQQVCVEICSGEAIRAGEDGVPAFDREKCVHCGACFWNCKDANIEFSAGPGGLHSTLN